MAKNGKQCPNPPEFAITISANDGEYMVGVTCSTHRNLVSAKLEQIQKQGSLPQGTVSFSELKAVGTDCVKGSADDLIQL